MTAQIINLRAWRLAHSEPAAMYSAAAAVWLWPVRVWLAWWGIRLP